MLCAFIARPFKWSEERQDVVSKLCKAVTNIHVLYNFLEKEYEVAYTNYRQFLYEKGALKRGKRLSAQRQYRARKRQKLSVLLQNLGHGTVCSRDGRVPAIDRD